MKTSFYLVFKIDIYDIRPYCCNNRLFLSLLAPDQLFEPRWSYCLLVRGINESVYGTLDVISIIFEKRDEILDIILHVN